MTPSIDAETCQFRDLRDGQRFHIGDDNVWLVQRPWLPTPDSHNARSLTETYKMGSPVYTDFPPDHPVYPILD